MGLKRISAIMPLPVVTIAVTIAASLFGGAVFLANSCPAVAGQQPAAAEQHRVAAIYFHRTQRCPTCKLIGTYIDEALKKGFPKELKSKRVGLYMVDYQNPKNKRYKTAYKIEGPTLVLAEVSGKKVTRWKPLPKVWSLMRKKKDFFRYVQQETRAYLEKKEKKK